MYVKWVKAIDGLGGQNCLHSKSCFLKKMNNMVADLSGTDDVIALYIASKYCRNKLHRSKICAFAHIPKQAVVQTLTVPNYAWNDNGNGNPEWPLKIDLSQPWLGIPDADIANLNSQLLTRADPQTWKSFQSALQGPPVQVDTGKYKVIGQTLSQYLIANKNRLYAVTDRGNHGATPGSHKR